MLIPVSVERFPICEVRCRCPTMYRCIVFLPAQMRTIFRLNTVVPPSFPTSLLPWFLNYDWQGGFVFPQLTLWKMAVSNSTKTTNGRKWRNSVFKICLAWLWRCIKRLPDVQSYALWYSLSDVVDIYIYASPGLHAYLFVQNLWVNADFLT